MSTLRFITACILICLGGYVALFNWMTPVLAKRSGRNVSMVPIVGGLLLGAGIYLVTGSLWWSLIAIPLDLGTIMLAFAIPWLIREHFANRSNASSQNKDIDA